MPTRKPIRKVQGDRTPGGHSRAVSRRTTNSDVFGFNQDSGILNDATLASGAAVPGADGELHVFGCKLLDEKQRQVVQKKILGADGLPWQTAQLEQTSSELAVLQTPRGTLWFFRPKALAEVSHHGSGSTSFYAMMRDRVGSLWPMLRDNARLNHLAIQFHGCSDEDVFAGLLGLELASYQFTTLTKGISAKPKFKITLVGVKESQWLAARAMGRSMNLARHLVNLDPKVLNPRSYAAAVKAWFGKKRNVSVEVWGPDRIAKEGMGLHFGVGQGAVHGSHMVRISYRPIGKARFKQPIAAVGKGITFDTGGLDIKPASGMRLMKKDMGGSASLVGLANWLVESDSDLSCDFYLALAENSVSRDAMHPGDILKARNGLTVEIHNTDAEGRLVLADVMDVAQTGAEKPLALIDIATLTGAMRVAVGTEIAGFFANNDRLADLVSACAFETGDPAWRLPLWEAYRSQLKSHFADMTNASDSGFGGAITAALFLQKFVRPGIPWLHFDLYCWLDRPSGALTEVGGNGQGVQLLAAFFDRLTVKDFA